MIRSDKTRQKKGGIDREGRPNARLSETRRAWSALPSALEKRGGGRIHVSYGGIKRGYSNV